MVLLSLPGVNAHTARKAQASDAEASSRLALLKYMDRPSPEDAVLFLRVAREILDPRTDAHAQLHVSSSGRTSASKFQPASLAENTFGVKGVSWIHLGKFLESPEVLVQNQDPRYNTVSS
jgi:hypothetical protein